MKVYQAWYSCYEDHGSLGYFKTRGAAEECAADGRKKIGTWTEFGDRIRDVGVSEIEVNESYAPLPTIDPSMLEVGE